MIYGYGQISIYWTWHGYAILKSKGMNFHGCDSMLSEDQNKKLAQGKENSPVEAPKASTSKSPPQQVPNKPKQTPTTNQTGKAKTKWDKPYPQNYRILKKEKTAMDNLFNMARTLKEFKNKEEERLN
ncbi:hypothetical protein O181_080221 [Austropuccinia psidii MF-1]|uniref:Uncharacterized protein n=1 Tax=Austropuccinia psidii MF-1 TaxID=1389203 RepID=A0A9Q3IER2_9BASI|nr:hypothetical protein [Austropuccinia psidii MF-1]